MPIRKITTDIVTAWLPPDYATTTTWTSEQVATALAEGHDPHRIAAEVWDEYALTLSPEATADGEKVIKSWQNIDINVTYSQHLSPRQYAAAVAQHHRRRAPIKSVALGHPVTTYVGREGFR